MDNQYQKFQGHVLRILEPATVGDKLSKFCDYTLSILVILNLVAVTLESVPELEQRFKEAFYFFEVFSVIVFTIEYLARIWSAPAKRPIVRRNHAAHSRWSYIKSFYGLIDFLSIMPFYLQAFFPGLDLRVLRTLRLIRILKLNAYNSALEDLFGAIMEEKRSFLTTLYIFIVAFVMSASLIYFAEY